MVTDYKTTLQEEIQKNSKVPLKYVTMGEEGPAHNKTFTVHVYHNAVLLGVGSGKSKKDAEQQAAMAALKKI